MRRRRCEGVEYEALSFGLEIWPIEKVPVPFIRNTSTCQPCALHSTIHHLNRRMYGIQQGFCNPDHTSKARQYTQRKTVRSKHMMRDDSLPHHTTWNDDTTTGDDEVTNRTNRTNEDEDDVVVDVSSSSHRHPPPHISSGCGACDRASSISSSTTTTTTMSSSSTTEFVLTTTTMSNDEMEEGGSATTTTTTTLYGRVGRYFYSDEGLLVLAFITFLTFASIQMIVAVWIAHSHAMIGDSSVMMIDAITYLCNGISERQKQYYRQQYTQQEKQQSLSSSVPIELELYSNDHQQHNTSHDGYNESPQTQQQQRQQQQQKELVDVSSLASQIKLRKYVVLLEIVAPTISVLVLIVVTILITKQAVDTIADIDSQKRFQHHAGVEPNLYIMLYFTVFNLLLDVINMYFFTRPQCRCCCSIGRRHRQQQEQQQQHDHQTDHVELNEGYFTTNENEDAFLPEHTPTTDTITDPNHTLTQIQQFLDRSKQSPSSRHTARNLNMCSAFTHVLADTLRSFAVITAVSLALIKGIEPALADATAALIVSFLIALSLIPLIQGLGRNMFELMSIRRMEHVIRYTKMEHNHSDSTTIV
jgi:Co/Zn/Cd efflux system component